MAASNDAIDKTVPSHETPRDITSFQRNLLIVLANEPMYGLAVKRELEEYYGEDVNHGRLYPNLDELVDMGLIEKSQLDKRTNQYELTETGRSAVRDQLDWFLAHVADGETDLDVANLISAYC